MNIALILALAAGSGGGATASLPFDDTARQGTQGRQPFAAAKQIPADVTMYLHVEYAAALRRDLSESPVADWFNRTIAEGEAGKVWSHVAKSAKLDAGELFDGALGRRITFVLRTPTPDAGDAARADGAKIESEWALLAEVAAEQMDKALAALNPIAHGPKSRMAVLELPEHELVLARRGDLLLVGPRHSRRLFLQMLRTLGGGEPPKGGTLADVVRHSPIGRTVFGGEGDQGRPIIEIFLRHAAPLGGHSAAVAQFAPELRDPHDVPTDVAIRHYGSFESPPFTTGVTRRTIDIAIVEAFDEGLALVLVEPNDTGRSAFELFLLTSVGEGLFPPAMRRNLGDRRLIVLSEVAHGELKRKDATRGEPAVSGVPSLAVCYELKSNGTISKRDMQAEADRQMLALSRRFNHLAGEEAAADDVNRAFPQDRPRHLNVPAPPRLFSERFDAASPDAEQRPAVSLNWTVAESPHGNWYVIASHPDHLEDVVSALSRPSFQPQPPATETEIACQNDQRKKHVSLQSGVAGVHSAGLVNGERLAQMLVHVRSAAPLFTADAKQSDEISDSLRLMSELAAALEQVRWQLIRPSEKEVELEVRIRLSR